MQDSQRYTGRSGATPNVMRFRMPDLTTMSCADDFFGAPEFFFEIKTPSGCHRGAFGTFVQMYDKDISNSVSLGPTGSSTVNFGNEAMGASVTCTDCGISVAADMHVLVRVDDLNPFAESWSWGSLSLEANVDLVAEAWVFQEVTFNRTVVDITCPPSVCLGITFAGVAGFKVGLLASLELRASALFDAQAQVTYQRRVQTSGLVALHTYSGGIYRSTSGFAMSPVSDVVAQPATLRLTVRAVAEASIHPHLYVGLFASVSTYAEAEVYFRVTAALHVSATLNFRTAIGTSNFLDAVPPATCAATTMGCNDACSSAHDLQLDANIWARCVRLLRTLIYMRRRVLRV